MRYAAWNELKLPSNHCSNCRKEKPLMHNREGECCRSTLTHYCADYFFQLQRTLSGIFKACVPCACMYSVPFLNSYPILPWVYEAILPTHVCHFKQLLQNAKVLNILIYMLCFNLLGSILPQNNIIIVCITPITFWSQNTLSELEVNFYHICKLHRHINL